MLRAQHMTLLLLLLLQMLHMTLMLVVVCCITGSCKAAQALRSSCADII
jgi:hypothetical protein